MELWENELLCSITTLSELKKSLELTQDELGAFENLHMPFRVTPHILHEIVHNDYGGKIRMQYIPHVDTHSQDHFRSVRSLAYSLLSGGLELKPS